MQTKLTVLSPAEQAQIHERSLGLLARTGVRVDTERGRALLRDVGARVDEGSRLVRLPRDVVEESIRLTTKDFVLGARRPGWDLPMNSGECTLLIDGEAVCALDWGAEERRPGTLHDFWQATCLIDALDEVGVFWHMIQASDAGDSLADWVAYWQAILSRFSKHIQNDISDPAQAPWFIEILQAVFGDRDTIRRRHPISFLLCPQSPLIIEAQHTDAYLALAGWDIPVAIMPMPLMGATAPASLVSTITTGNAEVLAMLCLIQAAAPGTPILYGPALAACNPRTGGYLASAIENGLMGAAATEMARYYGLPALSTGMATDCHRPGIQAGYDRALNGLLTTLSWPDILVGPGLLAGSMTLSLEQLLIDVEVFRMCRRAHQGISSGEDRWLDEVVNQVGPGGQFLSERSTVRAMRSGEWYISQLGIHEAYETWQATGRPTVLDQAHDQVAQVLNTHQPLPLPPEAERELERIRQCAQTQR